MGLRPDGCHIACRIAALACRPPSQECDQLHLQECLRYFRRGKAPDATTSRQTDSKLVLAGVRLGGADAYPAWDRWTYFEFDSAPSRSNGFSVSRVVEHPFKPLDRQKYRDDPDQIILTF